MKHEFIKFVIQCICDYHFLTPEEIDVKKSYQELGIDSLEFFEIIGEIEKKYNIKIEDSLLDLKSNSNSLSDIINIIYKYKIDKSE